jgi:hypothetical protein
VDHRQERGAVAGPGGRAFLAPGLAKPVKELRERMLAAIVDLDVAAVGTVQNASGT